jgi:tetratricopeptide (TPR) repeat protein
MRKICLASLLVPALVWAEPKTSDEWYKEGENLYTLGNFEKAVEAFKQGFSLETNESKKAAYLYNVAQSYRQLNDCKNELFFYRRFLALKDNDTVKPLSPKMRKDVEGWITESEACVQQATALGKKPPTNNLPPDGDSGDKNPSSTGDGHKDTRKDNHKDVAARGNQGHDDEDDGGSITKPAHLTGPHVISARLTGGGTKVGAGSIDVPVQFTAALVAGYPIAINDKLTVDAGAAFTFTPVPYNAGTASMVRNETAQLIGLMANAGATYEVIPKLGVRGDVGLGALFFANVSESPFTSFAPTSGALTMFHLRAALSADYAFTPNIVGTVTPIAFSYSPPKDGLDPNIKAITSIDFMLGIGYRM